MVVTTGRVSRKIRDFHAMNLQRILLANNMGRLVRCSQADRDHGSFDTGPCDGIRRLDRWQRPGAETRYARPTMTVDLRSGSALDALRASIVHMDRGSGLRGVYI